MVTTWRNINIDSSGSANALIASGGETLTRSLETLGNLAAQQGATQAANWDQVSQNNTSDLIAKLSTFTSSKALEQEIEGGQFSLEKMDAAFGRQYNKTAVAQALETRRNSLINMEKANALTQQAELNKQLVLEKTKRMQKFDAGAVQLLKQYGSDPSQLQSRAWDLARSLNHDGIIPMNELSQTVDAIVNRVKGTGLDEESDIALKMQKSLAPQMITEGTAAVDQAFTRFKKAAGYDENIDQLMTDSMTVADATTKLYEQIEKKGGKPDTVTIRGRVEEINNLFDKAGLPAPNGRVVYNLLTEGGHTGERSWLRPFSDPEFKLNTDVVEQFIQKVKTNQVFKENNADAIAKFAQVKADITDTTALALARNESELLRSARARSFTNETHDPQIIQLDSLKERNNMLIEELRKIKPAGI